MKCPYCKTTEHKVIDTRQMEDDFKRRRECLSCKGRWTTYEVIPVDEQGNQLTSMQGKRQ